MAKRQLPSPEELRQLLRYEPETGKLLWLERPLVLFRGFGRNQAGHQEKRWNTRYAGQEALSCLDASGYLHGRIFRIKLYAHRAAWALHCGEWPSIFIDHINGDRADNRAANLRLASGTENGWNRGPNKNNTTGYKGVTLDPRDGTYSARIMAEGVEHYLGRADTAEAAHARYVAAAKRLHGTFARAG